MPIANQIQQLRSKRQSIDNFSDIGGFAARKIFKNNIMMPISNAVTGAAALYQEYKERANTFTPRIFEEET
jgi:hypothetical protein